MSQIDVVLGAGLIGRDLIYRLVALGHKVRVIDRKNCPNEFIGLVEWHTSDFSKLGAIGHIFAGADYIYNLMPIFPQDLNGLISRDSQTYRCSKELIELALNYKLKGILVASSSAVYGNQGEVTVTETSETKPLSFYGKNKLVLEDLFLSDASDLDLKILRIANPYGVNQSFGASNGFIGILVKKIINNEVVSITNSGNIFRDYIYITDLIEGMVRASFLGIRSSSSIYNMGGGKPYSLNDVIVLSEQILGRNIQYSHAEIKHEEIIYSLLDSSLAAKDFSFQPSITFPQGLEIVFRHHGLC